MLHVLLFRFVLLAVVVLCLLSRGFVRFRLLAWLFPHRLIPLLCQIGFSMSLCWICFVVACSFLLVMVSGFRALVSMFGNFLAANLSGFFWGLLFCWVA